MTRYTTAVDAQDLSDVARLIPASQRTRRADTLDLDAREATNRLYTLLACIDEDTPDGDQPDSGSVDDACDVLALALGRRIVARYLRDTRD
jgi:hypothetical protein